jgi:hypothetical protein
MAISWIQFGEDCGQFCGMVFPQGDGNIGH